MATPFHTRAQTGLRPPRSISRNIDPEGVTAHYGGPSPWGRSADRSTAARFAATTDHARCATIWRGWQAFHMDTRGWSDSAYTSGVCPHGHRYEGRGPGVRTAANGTNAGNLRSYAVVYIAGDDDPVTDGAKFAYHDEAARLGRPLRWEHGQWKPTACAGAPIRAWQATGWRLPTSPAPTDPTTPTAPEAPDMFILRNKSQGSFLVIPGSGTTKLGPSALNALVKAGVPEVWIESDDHAKSIRHTADRPHRIEVYLAALHGIEQAEAERDQAGG